MDKEKELEGLLDKDETQEEKASKDSTKVKTVLGIILTFLYGFLTAVSMICVQALDERIHHFQLNCLRFFLPLCSQGIYFTIKQKLPRIGKSIIKPTLCYCIVISFCALSTYIPAIYIPLATANTLYITASVLFMIAWSIFMKDNEITCHQV